MYCQRYVAKVLEERYCQSCHNNAYHRHKFDEDIERWT